MMYFALCTIAAAATKLHADTSPIVGYGSSTAVLSTQFQEESFMGFEEGMKFELGKKYDRKMLRAEHETTGSRLAAVKVVRNLLKTDVAMIAGFPSSHESLLVAPEVRDANILFLSNSAGHPDLAKYGPTVYTSAESIDDDVQCLTQHAIKSKLGKRGLVLVNQRAVWSAGHEVSLKSHAERMAKANITLEYSYLDDNLNITRKAMADLVAGKYDFIVLTTFSVETINAMSQILGLKSNLPLLVNTNFIGTSLEALKHYVRQYKGSMFSCATANKDGAAYKTFRQLIQKSYGRPPSEDASLAFDAGVVVGQIIKRLDKKPITRATILEAFRSNLCFDETTSGRICFAKTGGHAVRRVYPVIYRNGEFVSPQN